jgi:uncharacterized protein YeaO (DUF488 family)
MIQLKRVYDEPSSSDGFRVLVDRLWPRGLTKQRAAVDQWLKDLAPSTELRKWFAHDPAKWKEFQTKYQRELADKGDLLKDLKRRSQDGAVTLLYGARDEEHNEAVVLQSVLNRVRGRSAAPKNSPSQRKKVK